MSDVIEKAFAAADQNSHEETRTPFTAELELHETQNVLYMCEQYAEVKDHPILSRIDVVWPTPQAFIFRTHDGRQIAVDVGPMIQAAAYKITDMLKLTEGDFLEETPDD